MKRRFKIVLNVEIEDPEKPHPAGGDYTHLNRIEGIARGAACSSSYLEYAKITLDKIVDKGEVVKPGDSIEEIIKDVRGY